MILLLILFLTTLLLYLPAFKWLVWLWEDDKAYSHGFLIPPIALYFVWIKRERLRALEVKPAYLVGGLVTFASAGLLLVGRVGAAAQIEVLSLMLMLPGIILFVWGWKYLRALLLPLLYLQFMVPWTEPIMDRIHRPFQIISAELGAWFLKATGMPVYLNGVYIQLPNITLEVAEECSGIKFLTSMVAIAIPLVYLTQRTWRRAIIVLVSALVITVVTNSVRVALAGLEGNTYGAHLLHGPAHIFRGWFVAQVGVVILFFFNWFVSRLPSQSQLKLHERWKAKAGTNPNPRERKASAKPVALCLSFLVVAGLYIYAFAMPRPVQSKQDLALFPARIGEWRGSESGWMKIETFFLNPDKILSRIYKNDSGKEVNIFVGYYESQSQDKRMVSLHDSLLHANSRVVTTGLRNPGPREVKLALVSIDKRPYEVIFWYDFPSGDLTGRYKAKIKTITDALLYRKNNAAVILLAAQTRGSADPQAPSEVLKDFLRAAAPLLDEYLP
jgi:EpsI family protein